MPQSNTDLSNVSIINEGTLKEKIYVIRGQQVMLDFDLAQIYGYTTKAFNQQVKNNIEKFENDFCFQLTDIEYENLRSNFLTSSWGGRRTIPYAFTEQGIYMLMTVLRGPLAVQQSKALIRLFKQMKDQLSQQHLLPSSQTISPFIETTLNNTYSIARLEKTLDDTSSKIEETRITLSEFMASFGQNAFSKEFISFKDQVLEADIAFEQIYRLAKKRIFVIDNYLGSKTLLHLRHANKRVALTIFSDNKGKGLTQQDLDDFNKQFPGRTLSFIKLEDLCHDRFIILDYKLSSERLFCCGASSKDAGSRASFIYESSVPSILYPLVEELLSHRPLSLKP